MTIAARIAEVRARIAEACRAAGRDPRSVELVAVSKTVEAARCAEAVAAGQQALGENYAQELRDKARLVAGARWHFIGPLQRNKVKYVVGTAELIHSVDSRALADEIAARAEKLGVVQRVLVQVNVGGEAQKSGCAPGETAALVEACAARPSLRCEGLMCIPPLEGDPAPSFRQLRQLAAGLGLRELSMGMSADFAAAIAEGATLVRVGTAIFGARSQHVGRP
ncbi:MAG TPA: YggS family pyridoxal phosphate-dependent enzyme [Polyangia bacterium]|nr:YggS family pyridoxal phosphate-dependent enzyme [Polyangia bacterium]